VYEFPFSELIYNFLHLTKETTIKKVKKIKDILSENYIVLIFEG
jgi:hypothetical protein